MKILVTGATGRIGGNLVKALSEKGHGIRGLVLPGDTGVGNLEKFNVEVMEGDFRKYEDCVKAVSGVDAIYHLGAYYPQSSLDEITTGVARTAHEVDMVCFDANVRGTFNMLEATSQHCKGCKRFIFASSDIVYSPRLYSPVDENHPVRGAWPGMYKTSKVLGEDMVNAYQVGGLPTVRCRFAMTSGPWDPSSYGGLAGLGAIEPMLSRLKAQPQKTEDVLAQIKFLEKEKAAGVGLVLTMTKDGETPIGYGADVRDIVHGLVLTLEKEAAIGEAFNFGMPTPFSHAEAIPYASKVFNIPYTKMIVPRAERVYGYLSTAKARLMLGYNPQYDIFKVIDDIAAFRRGEDVGVVERPKTYFQERAGHYFPR